MPGPVVTTCTPKSTLAAFHLVSRIEGGLGVWVRSAAGMPEATPRGFEPLRAEPNGFLVHLLNHSDTVSCQHSARTCHARRGEPGELSQSPLEGCQLTSSSMCLRTWRCGGAVHSRFSCVSADDSDNRQTRCVRGLDLKSSAGPHTAVLETRMRAAACRFRITAPGVAHGPMANICSGACLSQSAAAEQLQATPAGFEPARVEPIGLAGRRLNHSAKVSCRELQVERGTGQGSFRSGIDRHDDNDPTQQPWKSEGCASQGRRRERPCPLKESKHVVAQGCVQKEAGELCRTQRTGRAAPGAIEAWAEAIAGAFRSESTVACPLTTVWPSGLRRWLQAPVRKGVGSNPTAVTSAPCVVSFSGRPRRKFAFAAARLRIARRMLEDVEDSPTCGSVRPTHRCRSPELGTG